MCVCVRISMCTLYTRRNCREFFVGAYAYIQVYLRYNNVHTLDFVVYECQLYLYIYINSADSSVFGSPVATYRNSAKLPHSAAFAEFTPVTFIAIQSWCIYCRLVSPRLSARTHARVVLRRPQWRRGVSNLSFSSIQKYYDKARFNLILWFRYAPLAHKIIVVVRWQCEKTRYTSTLDTTRVGKD